MAMEGSVMDSFHLNAETNHLILKLLELDFKLKEINKFFSDSPVGWYRCVLGSTIYTTMTQSNLGMFIIAILLSS
jgi:hypothetical protein